MIKFAQFFRDATRRALYILAWEIETADANACLLTLAPVYNAVYTANYLLFIVQKGLRKAEGDDTNENVFSQGPRGKPPRHYTILAPITRSRYTRNIWPEPLMGYLWGWHVTEKTGIISACKVLLHYIILYSSLAFLLLGVVVDLLSCVSSLFFFRLTPPTRWRPSPLLVGCYSLSMHLQYFLKFQMFYNSLDGASGLLLASWC